MILPGCLPINVNTHYITCWQFMCSWLFYFSFMVCFLRGSMSHQISFPQCFSSVQLLLLQHCNADTHLFPVSLDPAVCLLVYLSTNNISVPVQRSVEHFTCQSRFQPSRLLVLPFCFHQFCNLSCHHISLFILIKLFR